MLMFHCRQSTFLAASLAYSVALHLTRAFVVVQSSPLVRHISSLHEGKQSEGIGIGIDLGTSYSAVAVLDNEGSPYIIPNPQGDRIIPSVVALDEHDVIIGRDAVVRQNAYRHVKRIIGTGGKIDRGVAALVPNVFPSREGKTYKKNSLPNQLHDAEQFPTLLRSTVDPKTTIRPESISSHIVQYLKNLAEEHTGQTVTRVVLGVPAYFNDAQRQASIEAAKLAGIDKVKLLREPEAAALAYGQMDSVDQDRDELVLVLDLGGGTYDVSLLVVGGGMTEIICTSGNVKLGGTDMDRKIGNHLMDVLRQSGSVESKTWRQLAVSSIVRSSEKIRVYLSNNRAANIALPCDEKAWIDMRDPATVILPTDESLLQDGLTSNSTHCMYRLTRKKLESLCKDELQALLRPLREVAIMGGALLPGDADPAMVEAALELEEDQYEDLADFPSFYDDDNVDTEQSLEINEDTLLKEAKKAQQGGRRKAHKVAKSQRIFRSEKSRLQQADQKVQNGIHGRPISRVVLVGGTTRMPAIGKLISTVTGVVPQRTVNPDEAVALGCAVHVGVLDGDERAGIVLNPMRAAILRALSENNKGSLSQDDFDVDLDDFEAEEVIEVD
jgi:molecular chaperone DnaK (HSP70)